MAFLNDTPGTPTNYASPYTSDSEVNALYDSNKFSLDTRLKFWALGDRVLIEEDAFKTGYECVNCDGSGKAKCSECSGVGTRHSSVEGIPDKKCSFCEGGTVTCTECNGKGGLLIAPDITQRRPATGRVVSKGDKVSSNLNVGDSILYSNFAGYVVDLARAGSPISLRILHESEVLCGMSGQLTLTNFKGKNDIAQFNP